MCTIRTNTSHAKYMRPFKHEKSEQNAKNAQSPQIDTNKALRIIYKSEQSMECNQSTS